jgi:hypothetical protein
MAKQKKKRNKPYSGSSAAMRPTVTRLSAEKRSKPRQWWIDNKRIAKPVAITAGAVIAIAWLLFELVRIILRSGA